MDQIREMPDDFQPEITQEDGILTARYNLGPNNLACQSSIVDPDKMDDTIWAMRFSIWQAMEMYRLGKTTEFWESHHGL